MAHPGGRPTKYRSEYDSQVVEWGREGKHLYQIAEKLNVCTSTLSEWARNYPEFSVALTRAKQYSKAYLIQKMMENIDNRNFNARLSEILMKFVHREPEQRPVVLAELRSDDTYTQQSKSVLKALAAAQINPDEAKKIQDSIALAAKVEEVSELKAIIERLEKENDQ